MLDAQHHVIPLTRVSVSRSGGLRSSSWSGVLNSVGGKVGQLAALSDLGASEP